MDNQSAGHVGAHMGTAPNVMNDWLSREAKGQMRLPAWLLAALDQARAGKADGRFPGLLLCEGGGHRADALVLVYLADLRAWLGSSIGADADLKRAGRKRRRKG